MHRRHGVTSRSPSHFLSLIPQNPKIRYKGKRGDVADVTYDDLIRRPVLCFFGGRNVVGVTAREPTVELPSPC